MLHEVTWRLVADDVDHGLRGKRVAAVDATQEQIKRLGGKRDDINEITKLKIKKKKNNYSLRGLLMY